MADVSVRLNISAQGDAAQKLQGAADAAQKASAQYQSLAASAGKAADSQSRLSSGGGITGPAGGAAGGSAAEQALTGAARQMSTATQQLAQSQRQSAAETRTAMQTQAQRSTESAQARAAGQGAEGGGLLSGALGKLIGGFVGIQGAQKVLSGAAGFINTRNDPNLDPSLRGQKAAESIPILGGVIKGFNELKEALDGTTKQMKQTVLDFEEMGAAAKRSSEAVMAGAALEARAAETRTRGEAIGPQRFFGMGRGVLPGGVPLLQAGDRTTVQGERAFEQAQRRLPAETAVRGAKLEESAARAEAEAARKQEDRLREDYEQKKARSETASRKVRELQIADIQAEPGAQKGEGLGVRTPLSDMGKAERLKIYERGKQAADEMLQANQALEQAVQRRGQTEVKVEQAASAARKANIGLMKEQLNVVNDEVQRISSASQAWAGLSAAEKMATENALERAKTQGLAALSGEERGLLGRAAPQFIAKEQEKAAQADPAFKRFQEAQGEKADLAAARKQQVELTNKVQLEVAFDEAKLAEGIAQKMASVFDKLDKLIQDRVDAQTRQFLAGLKVRTLPQ